MAVRRIKPPICTVCHRSVASFEFDAWPTLKLCAGCRSDAVQFICESEVLHGNPLLIELQAGLDNGDREHEFRIWVPSKYSSTAMSELYVRFEADSCSSLENPLDILDGIL